MNGNLNESPCLYLKELRYVLLEKILTEVLWILKRRSFLRFSRLHTVFQPEPTSFVWPSYSKKQRGLWRIWYPGWLCLLWWVMGTCRNACQYSHPPYGWQVTEKRPSPSHWGFLLSVCECLLGCFVNLHFTYWRFMLFVFVSSSMHDYGVHSYTIYVLVCVLAKLCLSVYSSCVCMSIE